MSKEKEQSGEKEWMDFKTKFNKFIWKIFVFQRIPILLMWLAFILGFILGILSK